MFQTTSSLNSVRFTEDQVDVFEHRDIAVDQQSLGEAGLFEAREEDVSNCGLREAGLPVETADCYEVRLL